MDSTSISSLKWEPYNFYRDRLSPFRVDCGDDLLYVIGLFDNGEIRRIHGFECAEDDSIGICEEGMTPGFGGIYFDSLTLDGHLIRSGGSMVDPYTVVAIARVSIPASGLDFCERHGKRSYIFIEQEAPPDNPFDAKPVFFHQDADRGEFALDRLQARLLIQAQEHGYGTPFAIAGGEVNFLEPNLLSDELDQVDCYAAEGVFYENSRHIFVAIAKRNQIIARLQEKRRQEDRAAVASQNRRTESNRKKKFEHDLIRAGISFDASFIRETFAEKKRQLPLLSNFESEFNLYISRIESSRFKVGVVSLLMKNESLPVAEARDVIQEEMNKAALKKIVDFVAKVEKVALT